MSAPLNGCGACGSDFTSLELFDAHRVGLHAFTYSEGIQMEPMREDGRRCLSAAEMTAKGWHENEKGRWVDPVRVERARRAFSELGGKPKQPTGAPVGMSEQGAPVGV